MLHTVSRVLHWLSMLIHSFILVRPPYNGLSLIFVLIVRYQSSNTSSHVLFRVSRPALVTG